MTHNTTIDYGNNNRFEAIPAISLTYFAKKAARDTLTAIYQRAQTD